MAVKPSEEPRTPKKPRAPRAAPAPQKASRSKPPRNNQRFAHDMWGIGFLALGGILLVSLIFEGQAGAIGDALAGGMRWLVGVGAWVMPFFIASIGVMLIRGREQHTRANFIGGGVTLYLIFITWWHLAYTTVANQSMNPGHNGGEVGFLFCSLLRMLFGTNDVSSHILLTALSIGAIVWTTDMRLLHLFERTVEGGRKLTPPVTKTAQAMQRGAAAAKERAAIAREERLLAQEEERAERDAARARDEERKREERARRMIETMDAPVNKKAKAEPIAESAQPSAPAPIIPILPITPIEAVAAAPVIPPAPMSLPPSIAKLVEEDDDDAPTIPQIPIKMMVPKPAPVAPLVIPVGLADDGTKREYTLPPLELLNEPPPKPIRSAQSIQDKQAVLMQTLNDFKIGANVAQVAMGPTVTRYEVQLEPGILVKKIVSLADNLAMSLAAIDVRVEAPIPGKSAIGIEVPNDVIEMVTLRECLATNEFMNAPSKLTFALGKDIAGNFKYADLTRMPHLLIGGSTNSGKSVCLNVIISSIVYRATPREVRFVMIDPKRVELSLYDGIPHLLSPVIKDVKLAAGILRSVLQEMEERYDRFAQIGTRNIEGFNNRVPPDERLPFIVVIIDELADLMMQQGPEVETSICRLAQLARATGIHLVIATQRPSVDVITGTIKSNVGSRIAFSVATVIDSRTILDQGGADRLIGRGDMLYLPIDAPKPVRVQGCYVGERETEELVKYLRGQEEAVYTMIPSETSASGTRDEFDDDGSSDQLFEPAVRWLVAQGSCSTSSLQRKFKVGYTRAARLVETMEALQIVGPQDGVKPREILLRPENLEAWFSGKGQGDLGQG
ncbi:DNA translocase FtsK [Capsulimonas corticalis]|uniref:DNA translocase FtsK n=1 Tax=Capsulimonas corticalis TaxID=2219043 RepID=A0A402CNS3_9BACT|nr:DNA translocase FtsK [Capsulimonas corticalis]BDI33186.1 DNA translocase FtsK [Capsulimonas corticalis]